MIFLKIHTKLKELYITNYCLLMVYFVEMYWKRINLFLHNVAVLKNVSTTKSNKIDLNRNIVNKIIHQAKQKGTKSLIPDLKTYFKFDTSVM